MGDTDTSDDVVTEQPDSVPIPINFAGLESGKQLPGRWMETPTTEIPGCPIGLECLSQLDQIHLFEEVTGFNQYRFQFKNSMDEQVYYAYAEYTSQAFFDLGESKFHVVNSVQEEVMRVVVNWRWCTGCCWCIVCCSRQPIRGTVESPPGQPIGYFEQRASCFQPIYGILDASERPILDVFGSAPGRPLVCWTCDVNFKLISLVDSRREIGKITSKWGGLQKEWYTNVDDFVIRFPKDLDVKVKGTVLGAMFLFDHLFFGQPLCNASNNEEAAQNIGENVGVIVTTALSF